MLENMTLINLVRRNKQNHVVLSQIFNPNGGCFGCALISSMTLIEACKTKNLNLQEILGKLV